MFKVLYLVLMNSIYEFKPVQVIPINYQECQQQLVLFIED